ncbi:MAG TPA: hypothetical protein VHZ51_21695 [Ktedonobacteraceae bacterium]|jgi:hypothetical protein|nr:hypothetical protein [Ktedonobacteraceae bacterium]
MMMRGFDWPAGRSKQVAYLDEQDHVQEMCVREGGQWQEHDLTEITNSPRASDMSTLVGFPWSAGETKQIVYMDRNRHIQELHTSMHGPWQFTDLTALTQAPLMDGTALAGYEWTAGNTKQVVYVDRNYHVQEMFVSPGGQWQVIDLTMHTGAPLAETAHIVGFDWPAGGTKQVAYIDERGHIIELHVSVEGQWRITDLTEITRAPLADHGNLDPSLAGFSWTAGGTKHLIYRDRNKHILEMYVGVGGQWQVIDLTMAVGAPFANSIGGLTCFDWPAGQTKQVVYVDANYQVQELYVGRNDQWHVVNVTAATGAPPVQKGPISGFAWSAAATKQIVYPGPRNSIQELYVGIGDQWRATDLTLLSSSLMLV